VWSKLTLTRPTISRCLDPYNTPKCVGHNAHWQRNGLEMDLSMTSAKPSRQSAGTAKCANSTFDTIRRTIVTSDKYVILSL